MPRHWERVLLTIPALRLLNFGGHPSLGAASGHRCSAGRGETSIAVEDCDVSPRLFANVSAFNLGALRLSGAHSVRIGYGRLFSGWLVWC